MLMNLAFNADHTRHYAGKVTCSGIPAQVSWNVCVDQTMTSTDDQRRIEIQFFRKPVQ